ncbi:hypothetical protein [Actinoallomurus acaciae]|uniref:Major facilitator superfamily (MFS) profile domain-containing protein n=1 Tax=Actinoallomurus acaciae TaxID=502577 RepID=A0ABV5YSE5_9ACTN
MTGAAGCAGGLYLLSLLTENAEYAGGLLGPILVIGTALGLMFVPLPLVALAGVADADSRVAASLLNATRQIGDAVGLAVLNTVAGRWPPAPPAPTARTRWSPASTGPSPSAPGSRYSSCSSRSPRSGIAIPARPPYGLAW